MNNLAPEFGLLTVPGDRVAARRYLFRSLTLSLVFSFVFVVGGAAANADVRKAPSTSAALAPQFAFADFDGDVRPDFVSIQAEANTSRTSEYRIQLQFSAGGRQTIRLAAPAGGLQIEARDVNGDDAVDLVLATAWLNQPVAVFLNNGHGSFLRAEPAAFPEAFSESRTKRASAPYQATETAVILPQSGAGICPETGSLPPGHSPARPILPPSSGFLASPLIISHAGRAPPSQVPHF